MKIREITEDFEPGTPSGNALDAIPTPDPKKDVAKRKISSLSKPR